MKVQLSRFHSAGTVVAVSEIKKYEHFATAWRMAVNLKMKPYLIGNGHLDFKDVLHMYPKMFDVNGSKKKCEGYMQLLNNYIKAVDSPAGKMQEALK